ncbi:Dedicator of cytokinesis protein 5 [Saguinus oedipus]|uniref:Dedicator of cytokinesis protein 5 n=1 Tax=Saguinus oedipus TaxID=9490 RepID=A0ABQ9UAN3_SAGOE|nr:Dedicator of cytokinesis protein 5 [Saguinus oedipus]
MALVVEQASISMGSSVARMEQMVLQAALRSEPSWSEDGDEFNDSIRHLFLSFNTLMDRPLEEAVKIKGAALKYLPSIINDVKLVFDPVELSVLFCKFIQSIPDNQLVRQKLNCMTKIVESTLFRQSGLHRHEQNPIEMY